MSFNNKINQLLQELKSVDNLVIEQDCNTEDIFYYWSDYETVVKDKLKKSIQSEINSIKNQMNNIKPEVGESDKSDYNSPLKNNNIEDIFENMPLPSSLTYDYIPTKNDIKKADSIPKNLTVTTGYNQSQLNSINSTGNTIVIAGAGAGKTKTFVGKIEDILLNKKSTNSKVFVGVFNEEAAKEIENRVGFELKFGGTNHSVFFRILKYFQRIDFDISIVDEFEFTNYINKNVNFDMEKKEYKLKIKNLDTIVDFLDRNNNSVINYDNKEDFIDYLNEKFKKEFFVSHNIIKEFFEQTKKVFTFNDIINEFYFQLKEDKKFRLEIKYWFDYIMLDEFQDTSTIILEIIKMIENNNFFMVGDPFQSINSFNGSDFDYIKDFMNDYKVLQLDTNYRSNDNIIEFANTFINNVLEPIEGYNTVNSSGLIKNRDIEIYENIDDYTIPHIISKSGNDLNDISILCRTNYEIKLVKHILNKWGIPFNHNDKSELKMIMFWLFLSKNDVILNDTYFDRFQKPNKSIDIKTFFYDNQFREYLLNRGYTDIEISVERYLNIFNRIPQKNLKLVLDNMEAQLIKYTSDRLYINKKGVEVTTIHKSKGLEWNTTILFNMENGVFPKSYFNSEEQRLFYVAITRAKEKLVFVSNNEVNSYVRECFSTYCKYKRPVIKTNINIKDNPSEDTIKFNHSAKRKLKVSGLNGFFNIKNWIQHLLEETNNIIKTDMLRTINDFNIEDIEFMLEELTNFDKDNQIEDLELLDMIGDVCSYEKEMFFSNNRIKYDFINSTFTNDIHEIINYDISKNDMIWIKKFKKITKRFVSKKYTDLIKDRKKNVDKQLLEYVDNVINNREITEYDDIINTLFKNFYIKSNKNKEYFVKNLLNMYDTLNDRQVMDIDNNSFNINVAKKNIYFDCIYEGEELVYNKEVLMGEFAIQNIINYGNKTVSKVKYLESIHKDKRPLFITFTLPTDYHYFKTKYGKSGNYGDSKNLIKNDKFECKSENVFLHFSESARKINEIWTWYYHNIKVNIENYKVKNDIDTEFELGFYRTQEPHKNLTSHLHSLIWIDNEIWEIVLDSYFKTIEHFGLNYNQCDFQYIHSPNDLTNKTFDLLDMEERDKRKKIKEDIENLEKEKTKDNILKIIDLKGEDLSYNKDLTVASPATYILKYTLKMINNEDKSELRFFSSWKSYLSDNDIKVSSSSNFKTSNMKEIQLAYKVYSNLAPKVWKIWRTSGKSLYYLLEKQIEKGTFIFEYDKVIKETFNKADYLKDIQTIFKMLKYANSEEDIDNFNIKSIGQEQINYYFTNIDLSFTLEDYSEYSDKYLLKFAENFVLSLDRDYSKIFTNKKIVNAYVSKERFDDKYLMSDTYKALNKIEKFLKNPNYRKEKEEKFLSKTKKRYQDFINTDWYGYKMLGYEVPDSFETFFKEEVNLYNNNRKNSEREDRNDFKYIDINGKLYRKIYTENMYIQKGDNLKGINNTLKHFHKTELLEGEHNTDFVNHINNVTIDMKRAFREEPVIDLLSYIPIST